MADKAIAKGITMIKTEQDGDGGYGQESSFDSDHRASTGRHTHTGNENALSDPLHLVF